MINLSYANNTEKLSAREVEYWKKVFSANLIFGSEVEFESNDSSFYINDLRRELEATGSVNYYGNGIEDVKSDGSLRNGAEITTPPRRIYSFIQMFGGFKNLIDKLYYSEPYISVRAGWHNHVSLAYRNDYKAQERNVPIIILKNLLTLCKLYYPGMCYFSSTIPEEGIYTRYNEFCQHDRLLRHMSTHDGRDIYNNFDNTRYNCLNLNRMRYNSDYSEIEKFHIEFRFPDGNLFPALMSSFQIMIKALILKSIELSRYGLISSDSSNIRTLYRFRNSEYEELDNYEDYEYDEEVFVEDWDSYDCPYRDRASLSLNSYYLNKVKENSMELIELLEDEISKIDTVAVDFCKLFSKTPVSVMFKEQSTESVEDINEILEDMIDEHYQAEDNSFEEIEKIISLGVIRNVKDKDEWVSKLGELVACKEDINTIIKSISSKREMLFNSKYGYYFKY